MARMTLRQRYEKSMDEAKEKSFQEWKRYYDALALEESKHPPRLLESGWTDTYWDGSFGPMHRYEIWTTPDPDPQGLTEEFEAETEKIFRRENKKVWGSKHTCGKRKCYWHD